MSKRKITPNHIIENNEPRAQKVKKAFNDLHHINKNCQDYEKEHILGYYSRSPNNDYLQNIINRLQETLNQLNKAKEI